MNIFLDSSVAIAASLSATGASREVFNHATNEGWHLLGACRTYPLSTQKPLISTIETPSGKIKTPTRAF